MRHLESHSLSSHQHTHACSMCTRLFKPRPMCSQIPQQQQCTFLKLNITSHTALEHIMEEYNYLSVTQLYYQWHKTNQIRLNYNSLNVQVRFQLLFLHSGNVRSFKACSIVWHKHTHTYILYINKGQPLELYGLTNKKNIIKIIWLFAGLKMR